MATGTVKWFAQALHDLGNKLHNLSSDDLRIGIVTNVAPPTVSAALPNFGGTGGTDYGDNQVAFATAYSAPITLASVSWTVVAGVPTLRASVVTIAQDASGFTNGAYGIIFNNSDANKRAIAWVELSASGAASNVAGPISINWAGVTDDVLTITQG